MFKSMLAMIALASPLYAVQLVHCLPSETVEDAPKSQSLTESITLIIKKLEESIVLLDSPYALAAQEHFQNIDAIAQKKLVQVLALIKIKKIDALETELVQKFASTYRIFHEKLLTLTSTN